MKKMYKYLEKIGATYEPVNYGSDYFFNVPTLSIDGAIVSFDYSGGVPSYYMKIAQIEKMILTYCHKYGYTVFNRGGFPGCRYFSICRTDDIEKLDYLNSFVRTSVDECERVIHEYIAGMRSGCENDDIRAVMDSYGRDYLESVRALASA